MKPPRAPGLDNRRTAEFSSELRERAQAWVPSWGLNDSEADFGRALLEIAARFSAEVAERFDGAGEKMRRGFLDWLAVRGEAARPARVPVVFKLAETAREAVLASAPVRLQADAAGAPVVFETEKDVRVIPGLLDLVVGADADADAFYLPVPGLSDLQPLEPLPTEWQLKSFAAAGTKKLQLDPETGLAAEMIVLAGGQQYRLTQVDKDIVTIDPPLAGELPAGSPVRKVTTFAPFDGMARNRQEHALYLGHLDLLNIEAAATLAVVGAKNLGTGVAWQYWGKVEGSDDVGWQPLTVVDDPMQTAAIVLRKPAGAIEPREIEAGMNSRWIRAYTTNVTGAPPQLGSLEIRVNCMPPSPCPPPTTGTTASPAAEAMANTTPLVLDNVFFPLGKEPRQFDAFYLGSQEAFSKKGASVQLCFEMADRTFSALSAVREGMFTNAVLAGVAKDRALHLFEFNATTGKISKFLQREPLQPPLPGYLGAVEAGNAVALDVQPRWRLPIWHEVNVFGTVPFRTGPLGTGVPFRTDFLVGVSAGAAIWAWREVPLYQNLSGWINLGQLPAGTEPASDLVDGLVHLGGDAPKLVALRSSRLYLRDLPAGPQWNELETKDANKTKDANNKTISLKSIVPILLEDGLVSDADQGMVGVSDEHKLYTITTAGDCEELSADVRIDVRPVAVRSAGGDMLVLVAKTTGDLCMYHPGHGKVEIALNGNQPQLMGLDVVRDGGSVKFLASVQTSEGSYLASWSPHDTEAKRSQLVLPDAGAFGGSPVQIGQRIVVPGTRADVFVSEIDEWQRVLGDTSTNPELSWEYWNGKGWWGLDVTLDATLHLKQSGAVQFEVPADIASSDWAGKPNHWIRARLIGGDYGREKITTRSKKVDESTTEQTIDRSSDIRAPSVVKLHISYSVCDGVQPTFVLAQDSGSIRDQSDANRTAGAIVDAFVPLGVTLGRLANSPALADAKEECPPERQCHGQHAARAGTAIAVASAPPVAARSATGRSILIGLSAAPSEAPVNILLLVDAERDPTALAPMTIEALVADRFVPIVAEDKTRALGESGLLSMTFAVKPTPRDLFGRTLTWLRLTPAAGGAGTAWMPTLRGAYLNAVWASATETLTRELLGSSNGASNLRFTLARPPVLHDTLELRVKEPLGDEDRAALRQGDERRVLSDVEELPGDWVLWTCVIDPGDESPAARVYALDETSGEIRFGDGLHGAIPPIGRDSIVAFSYQRTEPGAPGSDVVPANAVAARTAFNLVSPVESVEATTAADQAAGGAPPESDDRVLRFGFARLRHRKRAVSAGDLEDLALGSSPDIVQAQCLIRGDRVRLVVVMRGTHPQPNAAQIRELRRLLLDAAPPSLAALNALRIEGPVVRRLRIDLELRVATLDHAGAVAQEVKKRLTRLFDTAIGGVDKDGWALGENATEADVALALIDAPRLDSIAGVGLREDQRDGREGAWPETIRANELVMLADDPVRLHFATAEVGV